MPLSTTVDGTTYKYSNKFKVTKTALPAMSGSSTSTSPEINVYLDEYGYALYVSGVERAPAHKEASSGKYDTNSTGNANNGATLLPPDGTIKEAGMRWLPVSSL